MDAVIAQLKLDPQFIWSDSIGLREIEGRGMSVVCNEPVEPHTLLIRVPPKMLVNLATVNDTSDLETHDILALELLKRRRKGTDLWVNLMPETYNFMPALWPEPERDQLPAIYKPKIDHQLKRIEALCTKTGLPYDEVAWAWLAVNTRCLYWEKGGMTLAPAIDFLNHTCNQNESLKVEPSMVNGISVYTTRRYEQGEELTFCYGPHENGFLLAEYGFAVHDNPWNFIDISERIEKMTDRSVLEPLGYWGNWTCSSEGPSFRVEIALISLQTTERGLKQVANGYDDGRRYQKGSSEILGEIAKLELEKLPPKALNVSLEHIYSEYEGILRSLLV